MTYFTRTTKRFFSICPATYPRDRSASNIWDKRFLKEKWYHEFKPNLQFKSKIVSSVIEITAFKPSFERSGLAGQRKLLTVTLTLPQTEEKGREMPGKTSWQDGGAMKTRKERTSRGYLERSSKAVYKQLPHSENMTIKKGLAFFINAIIPPRPKCYLWVNFRGIEFFETKLKFKRREKNSSLCAGLTSSKKRRIKKFHVVFV